MRSKKAGREPPVEGEEGEGMTRTVGRPKPQVPSLIRLSVSLSS